MPADLTGRVPARTLAGLIDVLDRADGGVPRRRPLPRHAAAALSLDTGDLDEGLRQARQSLDSGAARHVLNRYVAKTRSFAA